MVSVIVCPSAASLHNADLYNSRNLYVFSWYQARQGTVNHLNTMSNGIRRNGLNLRMLFLTSTALRIKL
jgi:dethiobiotin synthetase